jgi:O-antigen/teichoic acid export membrane protein
VNVTTNTSRANEVIASPSLLDRVGRFAVGEDVRRASLAVLDQGLVAGLSFATSAIIATSCGRTGLGVAHLALTLLYLMMNVQGELLNAPYTIYRPRRYGRRLHAYSGSLFVHQAVLAALGIIAVVTLIGLNTAGVGPAELTPSLWVLLFASPFCLLHAFLRNFSFAAFQFRVAVAMDVTVAVLQLATLIVFVQLDMLSVPLLFAVMGTSSLVACIGWFVIKPEPLHYVRTLVLRHWRENWSFGRWALASHIVGCAGNYVLPWMLAIVHDQAATGTFAGCGKLTGLAATFVVGVSHFLSPTAVAAFAKQGVPGLKRVLFTAGLAFVMTVGGFCIFVGMTGDFVLVSLFGDDFVGTGPVALVLSLAVLANSLSVLGGNGLWAINRPETNLISDIVAATLTLLTAAALVHSQGVMGIAIAAVVGGTFGAVVRGTTLAILLNRISRQAKQ